MRTLYLYKKIAIKMSKMPMSDENKNYYFD